MVLLYVLISSRFLFSVLLVSSPSVSYLYPVEGCIKSHFFSHVSEYVFPYLALAFISCHVPLHFPNDMFNKSRC